MEFKLLGPVEVWADDRQLTVGGPKPRALLATLLLERGRVVATDRLIDVLWPDDPPETARALIQTYVAALRRGLAGADRIETRPPGYRIDLTGATLDLAGYEGLVATARAAAAAGRPGDALHDFRRADDLWRGAALGGIGGVLAAVAEQLEDLRLTVLEDWVAAALDVGQQTAIIERATAALARYPLRERLRGQLMTALYRVGRQAQALAVFEDGRKQLAEQLGIDPGPELRRLHEAVLRNDPQLAGPAPVAAAPPAEQAAEPEPAGGEGDRTGPPRVVPAQLPAGVADFTGRTTELHRLTSRLAGPAEAGVVAVGVITGAGGVGKSALALSVVHQVADRFTDGQLYADLGGSTAHPAGPADVQARFLRALGVDQQHIPVSVEERIALYRTTTAGRRLLVMLDDAASEHQVRPLLPGAGGPAVVVTSRRRLSGLAGADVCDLSVLRADDALDLLAKVSGRDRVAAEPDQARRIIDLCGSLPLAVRTAGARLAARRQWSFARFAGRLANERQRLDELSSGDLEVRASLALGYQGLDERARFAFRRLGLLGAMDFAPWIAGPLLDLPAEEAEELVEQLVDVQLLELSTVDALGQVRYRMHELLQVYARERSELEDSAEERADAVTRALRAWLAIIVTLAANGPSGEIDLLPPEPLRDVVPDEVLEPALADPAAWFDIETPSLLASLHRAADGGLHRVVAEVVAAMCSSSFVVTNRFEDWWSSHDVALQAARQAGDAATEAMLLTGLGRLRSSQDDYPGAEEYFTAALARFEASDDRRGRAVALSGLGDVSRELGRFAAASDRLEQALEIFRQLDDQAGIGFCSRRAGALAVEQGRDDEGLALLTDALAACRQLGSRRAEAITLRSISLAHRAVGDYEQARDLAARSARMLREIGDSVMEVYAVQSLVKAELRLLPADGTAAAASTALQTRLETALETSRSHRDRFGEALVLRTLGELHLVSGRPEEAIGAAAESIRLWQELGLPLFIARTQRDTARGLTALGRPEEAQALDAQAVAVFRQFGTREQHEPLHG